MTSESVSFQNFRNCVLAYKKAWDEYSSTKEYIRFQELLKSYEEPSYNIYSEINKILKEAKAANESTFEYGRTKHAAMSLKVYVITHPKDYSGDIDRIENLSNQFKEFLKRNVNK